MAGGFTIKKMAEVAPLVRRPVEVREACQYRQIGIRSFGKGTFHKSEVSGLELGTKKVFEVWPGDLLFNIVFAWEGAVAVATESEAGMIGSHRFLTCRVNPEVALPQYLFWYFCQGEGLEKLLRASPGGAGRNRTLNIAKLKDVSVPLPKITEQRNIVARLDAVAAKLRQIDAIQEETNQTIAALETRALREELARYRGLFHRPLSEIVVVTGGGTPSRHNPMYWEGDIPWATPKDMKRDVILDSQEHISEEGVRNSPAKLLNAASVLIVVRGMILARTVPVARVERPMAINQDMKALAPMSGVRSDYLWAWLLCCGDELLSRVGKSTHDTRKLESDALLSLPVHVPDESNQQDFVERVRHIRAKIEELKRRKMVALAERTYLLPAMLHEIFGDGEVA